MSEDPFRHDDGAYVLGALSAQDRAAFEEHLLTCAECTARVEEARLAVGLLSGLTAADVADPGPVPETLLPGLLRRADKERVRRRFLTTGIAAVAAACITALVVVLWPGGGSSNPESPALAFAPVRPSPVTATATVVPKRWGTEIILHCRYSDDVERWEPYRLVVVDDRGGHHEAGSWTLAADDDVNFTSGTAVHEEDIRRIEITLEDGSPILQLRL